MNEILPCENNRPEIHPSVFIAEGCSVIGRVAIGELSSVWFKSVIRGDQNKIIIGARTNIQDGVVVHVSEESPCIIGDYVTIGHNAVVHACTIGSMSLIAVGSIVLDGAVIGEGSVVAAGTVVTHGKEFPPRSVICGTPGRVTRGVSEEEYQRNIRLAETYVKLAGKYKNKAAGANKH